MKKKEAREIAKWLRELANTVEDNRKQIMFRIEGAHCPIWDESDGSYKFTPGPSMTELRLYLPDGEAVVRKMSNKAEVLRQKIKDIAQVLERLVIHF